MKTITRLCHVYSRRYPVAQGRYHVPKAALMALLYRSVETGKTYLLEVQTAQAVESDLDADSAIRDETRRPIRSYKNMKEYEKFVKGRAALIALGLTSLIAALAWSVVIK